MFNRETSVVIKDTVRMYSSIFLIRGVNEEVEPETAVSTQARVKLRWDGLQIKRTLQVHCQAFR